MSKFRDDVKIGLKVIERRRIGVTRAYDSGDMEKYETLFDELNEIHLHNAEVDQRAVRLHHFKKMCGGLDGRHTVHQQYTGHSEIMYTAWFCSEKVGGSFASVHDAKMALCRYEFDRKKAITENKTD